MDQYCKVMEEHLSKGYIEKLSDIKQPWPEQGCHYLSHFLVLKDSEITPCLKFSLPIPGKSV